MLTIKKCTRTARREAVRSPLETYLREISETALLTADEERELARRIEVGDTEARDRMVRANLRLVVNIARGYTGGGLALQDLIAEGNLGLLRAVDGFDPARGTRFATYATYGIKQSIRRGLVNSAKTVRVPKYTVNQLAEWRRATNKLTDELGRPPTVEEVARLLGLPRRKLDILKQAIRVHGSTPQGDRGDEGRSIGETLADRRSGTPVTEMIKTDDLKHLMVLLEKMGQREATVLRMRFGLDGDEPRTLREIGGCLGLTHERVRQIERKALEKLKADLDPEGSPGGTVKKTAEVFA
jgi:RNA polymerase primary sigma factor